ncbi:dTDP-4-dehydrorhamnose reductase [bacterium BMS3Bbin04]|nr:dTDP-4-dehydrorhamnose reductase [bacterium BMS3Bbin04]
MKRILITGCHGLLGQKLVEILKPDFYELHGIDVHKDNLFPTRRRYTFHSLDLTNRSETLDLVQKIRPHAIINTAAMTHVDACEIERERCWRINSTAVETLVDAARRIGSHLVQISSDYVFDGEAGPYSELDRPNPISYYGKSKHASENAVIGGGIEGTIIRTVVLYGHGRSLKPSFVAWLVNRLRHRQDVKIVTDQISNTTLVDDLANAIIRSIVKRRTGIYHVAGKEILSRFEFALEVAKAYRLSDIYIQPTLTSLLGQKAPRPLQGGLLVDAAEKDLEMQFKTVEEQLILFREQEAMLN